MFHVKHFSNGKNLQALVFILYTKVKNCFT
jgi:hypothetical protein